MTNARDNLAITTDERTRKLPQSEINKIKKFMSFLAEESANIIKPYFNPNISINIKEDSTPVTQADKETEHRIRQLIMENFPSHGIIGEEFAAINPNAKYQWVIDPIDGTKSFINGSFDFGTLVALLENGEPIVGLLSQPILGEVFIGDGRTTELNGHPIKVKEVESLEDAILLITYTHSLQYLGTSSLSQNMKFTKTWGNCYSYAFLAKGYPIVVVDPTMEIYDFMALVPIIRGAGGRITDMNGNEPTMKSTSIVASSKALHAKVIDILKLAQPHMTNHESLSLNVIQEQVSSLSQIEAGNLNKTISEIMTDLCMCAKKVNNLSDLTRKSSPKSNLELLEDISARLASVFFQYLQILNFYHFRLEEMSASHLFDSKKHELTLFHSGDNPVKVDDKKEENAPNQLISLINQTQGLADDQNEEHTNKLKYFYDSIKKITSALNVDLDESMQKRLSILSSRESIKY